MPSENLVEKERINHVQLFIPKAFNKFASMAGLLTYP